MRRGAGRLRIPPFLEDRADDTAECQPNEQSNGCTAESRRGLLEPVLAALVGTKGHPYPEADEASDDASKQDEDNDSLHLPAERIPLTPGSSRLTVA